jgi:hypothetical protein
LLLLPVNNAEQQYKEQKEKSFVIIAEKVIEVMLNTLLPDEA